MPDGLLWILPGLLAVFLFAWFITRIRTVPEGHIDVLQQFDKLSRYVEPGLYWLRPFEEKEVRLKVRKREMTIDIPGIFTHGGMPLTVLLDYEMRLEPSKMSSDELYYEDYDREDQQRRILKGLLQEIIREIPAPARKSDPNQVDTGHLFSPFLAQANLLPRVLEERARRILERNGILIGEGSLLISRLNLPQDVIVAYNDALAKGFTSAAEHEMMKRLREGASGMSDTGLVQLVNAIRNNESGMSTIFASGGFTPDLRLNAGQVSVPVGGATAQPSSAVVETPAARSAPVNPPEPENEIRNLTPIDMALLRSLDK